MAVGKHTLLDLAARSGKGIHALVEGVTTYAPELMTFPVFAKAGITYSVLTRTGLPSGNFRKVGGGAQIEKSEFKRETGSMALFEAQMRVAEDIVVAARAETPDLAVGDILADEAIATLRGSAIKIGAQTWYGKKVSEDGFVGLQSQVAAGNIINAGGATNTDTTSVYLVRLADSPANPEGVHMLLGNNGRMNFSPTWNQQQIEVSAGKFANVFTNNFLAYLGLVVTRDEDIYQVKNVKSGNAFTDAVAAEVLSKVPVALKADRSRLRWFMNSNAQFLLQASRTATLTTDKGIGATGAYPAEPTSCQGIPIVLTDSIVNSERNGARP